MRDYLTLGPTPSDESCAQVGSPDYLKWSRIESAIFIDQLNRVMPPPEGARFSLKTFQHDFGSYVEVVANYDDDNEEQVSWAYKAESETPLTWDTEAISQLQAYNYPGM